MAISKMQARMKKVRQERLSIKTQERVKKERRLSVPMRKRLRQQILDKKLRDKKTLLDLNATNHPKTQYNQKLQKKSDALVHISHISCPIGLFNTIKAIVVSCKKKNFATVFEIEGMLVKNIHFRSSAIRVIPSVVKFILKVQETNDIYLCTKAEISYVLNMADKLKTEHVNVAHIFTDLLYYQGRKYLGPFIATYDDVVVYDSNPSSWGHNSNKCYAQIPSIY